jgi:hypothetical protein
MIPTEEMVDPDAETHEVTSKARTPQAPKAAQQERIAAARPAKPAQVTQAAQIPAQAQATPPADPLPPVLEFLAHEREELRKARKIGKQENNALWNKQIEVMKAAGLIPAAALSKYSMDDARQMVQYMYSKFKPEGTELIPDDGQVA